MTIDGYTLDNITESLSSLGTSSGDSVQLSITGRDSYVRPKVDYSIFNNHIFFGNAKRKFDASLERILNEYPIGLNGSDILSLCAQNIYFVDKYIKESTGFDLWLLEELSRGTIDGETYTVTASAVNDEGENVPLILIDRDSFNRLTGDQVTLSGQLLERTYKYEDESVQIVDQLAGTAFYDVFSDEGISREITEFSSTAEKLVKRAQNIYNLLPQHFYNNDYDNNLEKLLSTMAELIDDLKLYIDNIPFLKNISYREYNTMPDKFLPVIAREFGVTLIDSGKVFNVRKSLVNSSADGYTSKRVTYDVWRRILNNMMMLFKTKGTKECLSVISRIYGLDENLININEYSLFNGPVRVREEREYPTPILYSDGTRHVQTTIGATDSSSLHFDFGSNQDFTIEARVSATSISEHTVLEHPLYNIKINNDSTVSFNSVTTPSVTVQTSVVPSITSFMNTEGNFINITASRSADDLNIYVAALSASPTGGDEIVVSAKSTYNSVDVSNESYDSTGGTVGGATNFPGNGSFNGYIHQVRSWDAALVDDDIVNHARNFESVSINASSSAPDPVTFDNLLSHFKLKENKALQSPYNYIVNSVYGGEPAEPINFSTTENHYSIFYVKKITNNFPISVAVDDDRIRQEDISENQKDIGSISFSFNPINSVNRLIKNYIQDINLYDLLGNPTDHNSYKYTSDISIKWHDLTREWGFSLNKTYDPDPLTNEVLKTSGGATGVTEGIASYNDFIKSMSNFDDIFGGMFKFAYQFIPSKTNMLADGVLIEPHIFERNKTKRRFGYRVGNSIDQNNLVDDSSFTADMNVITNDEGREDYNAVPSIIPISTIDPIINNHFLIGDLAVTGSNSANTTELHASAATTATFQGFQYKDNNIQDYCDYSYDSVSQIRNLTQKSTVNQPTFSQARYGRFSPISVKPSRPDQSEVDITLDQYIIAPTADTTSQRGFISGRVRLIVGGEDFKTDDSALSFEFPASSDGTNYFIAEIGDIDAGKGRIVKDKDLTLSIPLETKNVQFLLKLSDVVSSLSAVAGDVTLKMVEDSVSGSIGIVPIKINNLFNNRSYIFNVAINSDSTKDTDFIRQITETGIESVRT